MLTNIFLINEITSLSGHRIFSWTKSVIFFCCLEFLFTLKEKLLKLVELCTSSNALLVSCVTLRRAAVAQEVLKSPNMWSYLACTNKPAHTQRCAQLRARHTLADPSVSSTHTYWARLFINLHFNTHSGCRQHICSQQSLRTAHFLYPTHTHKQVLCGWDLIADTDIRSPPRCWAVRLVARSEGRVESSQWGSCHCALDAGWWQIWADTEDNIGINRILWCRYHIESTVEHDDI